MGYSFLSSYNLYGLERYRLLLELWKINILFYLLIYYPYLIIIFILNLFLILLLFVYIDDNKTLSDDEVKFIDVLRDNPESFEYIKRMLNIK